MNNNTETAISNKHKRIVNICGYAPSSKNILDVGENWVVNHTWIYGMRVDKWFIMDSFQAMQGTIQHTGKTHEEFIDWVLANHSTMQIISTEAGTANITKPNETTIPVQIDRFPLDLATSLIPGNYFNNSIVYMIIYAILQEKLGFQKVDVINLYGIELWISPDTSEYSYQRPCLDWWLPFANGAGIQIMIPAYLLYAKDIKDNLYGYHS